MTGYWEADGGTGAAARVLRGNRVVRRARRVGGRQEGERRLWSRLWRNLRMGRG